MFFSPLKVDFHFIKKSIKTTFKKKMKKKMKKKPVFSSLKQIKMLRFAPPK